MDYERVIREIPDYREFLTVEELDESSRQLAARFPDRVELSVIGHSGSGRPLYCLKFGRGGRAALAFGCPHPTNRSEP